MGCQDGVEVSRVVDSGAEVAAQRGPAQVVAVTQVQQLHLVQGQTIQEDLQLQQVAVSSQAGNLGGG